METQYKIHITPNALQQMQDIQRYIAGALQAPETAQKWLDTMETEINSLSFMPARIPLTEEEPWHSQGIHKMLVKHFFVYFWINTEKRQVQITAVVYAKRSQKQQFKWSEQE